MLFGGPTRLYDARRERQQSIAEARQLEKIVNFLVKLAYSRKFFVLASNQSQLECPWN